MKKQLLISFLLLILLLLSGCNDKVSMGDNNDKVVREELLKEEESLLLDRIENLKYIDFYGKSIKISNLTNQEILQILNSTYADLDNISFNELEEKAKSYFNYYLNPEDILCDTHTYLYGIGEYLYNYDSINRVYKFNTNHTGHKEVGIETKVFNHLLESYKEGDKYYIVLNKVFSELINSDNSNYSNYYSNYMDAVARNNVLFSTNSNVDDEIVKYLDVLNRYTYTFIKNDDTYYLYEYKIN